MWTSFHLLYTTLWYSSPPFLHRRETKRSITLYSYTRTRRSTVDNHSVEYVCNFLCMKTRLVLPMYAWKPFIYGRFLHSHTILNTYQNVWRKKKLHSFVVLIIFRSFQAYISISTYYCTRTITLALWHNCNDLNKARQIFH